MTQRLQKFVGYSIVTADGRGGARYLPGNEKVFVTGQTINGIFRRGKFMVFMLDRGAILAHNAMSGYWDTEDERWTFDYVEGKRDSKDTDIRCCFLLCPPGEILSLSGVNVFFHDARKFGYLRYYEPAELATKLSKLGPEVMTTPSAYIPVVMDLSTFKYRANRYKKTIKEFLMNQEMIAGVGNIYAAEALWMAKVDPARAAQSLTSDEQETVLECTKVAVDDALRRGLDYSGLFVYRQKMCMSFGCNTKIQKKKIAGRSTYFCPSCQH